MSLRSQSFRTGIFLAWNYAIDIQTSKRHLKCYLSIVSAPRVELLVYTLEVLLIHVCINLRRADVRVA